MDPVLPYPPSSRLVCAVAHQGGLPSPQATFGASGIGLSRGSSMNSYTVPLTRAFVPQPTNFISHTVPHSFPPAFETNRSSLPTNFNMAPNSLFRSPIGASPLNPAQPYHPLYASYNACLPSPASIAPFNQTTSFSPVPLINYQESMTSEDPSSTTVFVAGLPTCITEETLKAFFQNFGEIAYVKIPPQKGYGFIKYVRREDAKQAIIKMNDFPIHENSRIRLSWGRSLGDKKVEYVKKLSSALGISFESVWKIVQGQDPATIKQIASTVCGHCIAQPYEPSKLIPLGGLDQQHQATCFPNFGPVAQNHTKPLNSFPSVLSTHNVASSPNPLHLNNAFTDALGVSTRSNDSHYPNGHATTSENGYYQRPTSAYKVEPSSTCTSRPKALSQGSGPLSLPPPSWALRNSWEELFPKEKFYQLVESPVSSINEIHPPEVSTARRATIPSVIPISSVHDRTSLSERDPTKSSGSAIISSSSQASSSLDSFDTSAFSLKQIPRGKPPLVEEKDEYHLGFDGFLHGLLEEEGREDVTLDHSRSTFYQLPRQPNFTGEPSFQDLFPWGPQSSDVESGKLSHNNHSDWPRTSLGPAPTCISETVKSIFNSPSPNPPHLDQAREADTLKNTPSFGHLTTWNFPSNASDSNIGKKMNLPSISDSQEPVSPIPDPGIKPSDSLWTLSL